MTAVAIENRVGYIGPAQTLDEAFARLKAHQGFIAVDTETVSIQDKRCVGIGLAIGKNEAFYFPAFKDDPNSDHFQTPHLGVALATIMDSRVKVWFNATFDLEVLEALIPNIDKMNWQDVSIACRVQAMHNSLDMNAGEYLGIHHFTIEDILDRNAQGKAINNTLRVDMRVLGWKCAHDCMVTWELWERMQGWRFAEGAEEGYIWRDVIQRPMDVTPQMVRAYRTDRALIPLLRRMGKRGLKLNIPKLREHYTRLAEEKFRYLDICQQQFGFNPGSNQQTGYILASRYNFLPWTKNGAWKQFAVDGDTLSKLSDPLAHLVLAYRSRADKLSDVIEPLLGKPPGQKGAKVPYAQWVPYERFTTHFRLDLATSRLASSDRNIQNITPELREIFEPDNGVYTWWDANQIEYRIFGYLSGEPNILDAYREGRNVHEITMQAVWPGAVRWPNGKNGLENPLYTDAKTGNYSVIYFVEADTLARTMKRDRAFCENFIARWRENNPVGFQWMLDVAEDGFYRGWVPTLEGRRCRVPDPVAPGGSEDHTRKCSVNYRIQGSAAWPIKLALLEWDKVGFDQRVQLHDEVVNDGDYMKEMPPAYKLHLGELEVPVEVKSGRNWF